MKENVSTLDNLLSNFIITYVSLDSLKTNPEFENAYSKDKDTINLIKQSILKSGLITEIFVDANNVIIDGHIRYLALKELRDEGLLKEEIVRVKKFRFDATVEPYKTLAMTIIHSTNIARRQLTKEEVIQKVEELVQLWDSLEKSGSGLARNVIEEKMQLRKELAEKYNVNLDHIIWIDKNIKRFKGLYEFVKSRKITDVQRIKLFKTYVSDEVLSQLTKEEVEYLWDNLSRIQRKVKGSSLSQITDKTEYLNRVNEILDETKKELISNKVNKTKTAKHRVERKMPEEKKETEKKSSESKKAQITDEDIRMLIDVEHLKRYIMKIVAEITKGGKPTIDQELYLAIKPILMKLIEDESLILYRNESDETTSR